MQHKISLKRRPRGVMRRYREWLTEHPEILEHFSKNLAAGMYADLSKYSEKELERLNITKELLEVKNEPIAKHQ